jgi:hypothetical protein
VYGTIERPRGYLYGASGGAYQTVGALESTTDVWDGGVPMVPGVPNAIPSYMTAQFLGLRVLHDALPRIVDALEPGGSGDPYAGLDHEQSEVLHEITRIGFPLRGWWQWQTLSGGAFAFVLPAIRQIDPTYVEDFWTKPGYEGAEPGTSLRAARVRHETTVVSHDAAARRLVVADAAELDLHGADVVVTSGPATGTTVAVESADGPTIRVAADAALDAVRPGDRVRLDNSWNLALQYYYRHQVPTLDQYGWNQFRGDDGTPVPPQRTTLVGPRLARAAGGSAPTGTFHGKMIMLASTMDVQAFPWSADWYRRRATADKGSKVADSYRLWFMDHADHTPPAGTAAEAHIVSYQGELEQALLDLDAWVQAGTAPPASTTYRVDDEDQIQLPASAKARRGLQPVVTLRADGGPVVRVQVGAPVTFTATATTPPGTGKVVATEWDFDGTGTFEAPGTSLHRTHTYTTPGTYFAVVRVTSQRTGDRRTPYTQIQNLARVRVVVTQEEAQR